ncbi:hypothetical protein FBZ96_10737 [Bradyrhizobium stylosanthis]|uniref:Uncharacterized protein n=1 Tax=Bradyrhizobium stylosanthis TaxID=1803665 RepID=A0A560DFG9_9BRAD|nr:hypothetical protein FBZ96_10737 [Bradyrhizobium stylosanthis]
MQSADKVTLAEAYASAGHALEKIAFLLAGLRWVDGAPVDPAMWQDWLAAAQTVKGETVKKHHSSYPARSAPRSTAASRWALPNCKRTRVSVRPSLVIP